MVDPSAIVNPVESVSNILDKLGILERIRSKLFQQRGKAAQNLSDILGLLKDGYTAINEGISELVSLSFDEQQLSESKKLVSRLEGGDITAKIAMATPHCFKIGNIYRTYLQGWFSDNQKKLTPKEYKDLKNLFERDLVGADAKFVQATDILVPSIEQTAREIRKHIDRNELSEAKQIVKDLSDRLEDQRNHLKEKLKELQKLHEEYIRLSGAT